MTNPITTPEDVPAFTAARSNTEHAAAFARQSQLWLATIRDKTGANVDDAMLHARNLETALYAISEALKQRLDDYAQGNDEAA